MTRKVFLVTAGILSFLLAGGSAFSIATIKYAEHRLTRVETGPDCTGDCIHITHTPGECSKSPCNFLILGSDSRSGLTSGQQSQFGNTTTVPGQRADTIILVNVDPIRNRTVVLSIPRDLRVEIPGYGFDKINSAFEHKHGADLMVQTVEKLTGMRINHFVEVNFTGFERLVSALGGVHICIDKPMEDKLAGLHLPQAGCYDLKGAQALAFVRARHVEGDTIPDFSRISRQQQFMRVVIQKLLSFGVVLHFRSLIDAVQNNLVVDDKLNLYSLQDLTRKLSALGQRGVFFRVVPSVPTQIAGVDYLELLPEARALFSRIKDGKQLGSLGREAAQTNVSPASISVRVYDAGSGGQAQKVVTFLEDAGFVVLPMEPAPAGLTKSEIVYRKGFTDEERVVASYLSSLNSLYNYREAKDSGANVAVVIGSDFKGIEF
jgi:LCP family protein required for cell wall assembly